MEEQMSQRIKRHRREAFDLRDRLIAEGRHLDAQIVQRLWLSVVGGSASLRGARREVDDLRARLDRVSQDAD